MDIKGKVLEVSDVIEVTDSFKKREMIVEYAENPQYPEFIKFEAVQDKCALFDKCKPGDTVEIFFNLRGRPWTDKNGKKSYFNSLQAWKVNLSETPSAGSGAGNSFVPASVQGAPDVDDDLPF